MEKKFFMSRFRNYFLLLIIPTFLVFVISFLVVNSQIDKELDNRAIHTLSNVNTNLDFVISNVVLQNDQLTNNSYMVLALKKLLKREPNIQYGDAIYLRNIKTMLSSILQSYTYIQSVSLYLDQYDYFFSSETGVTEFTKEDYDWKTSYSKMEQEMESMVESRWIEYYGRKKQVLTIYQRMLLLDGVVVMDIDVDKYRALLDKILISEGEQMLFYDNHNQLLFSWKDDLGTVEEFDFSAFMQGEKQNKWIRINGVKYLVHTEYNSGYQLYLVSLISYQAKMTPILQMLKLFGVIFLINSIAMLCLAYFTTNRTFKQLHYMIQVFRDAEVGIYPLEPKHEMKDEYDVIMNNIIYLFLQTVKLNSSLVQRQHEQEVAELTALQLQINPHFLFNTLQNVQLEIRKMNSNSDRANKILDHLSDILKYALGDPMETITLKDEVEYLKKYVAIQHFRFGERFIAYYEIEEGLMNTAVFRLMLQPLVENSILHGIRTLEGKGYIKIQVLKRNGEVIFRVVDNGVGMSKEECQQVRESMKTMNIHHIGLSNVNSRLRLRYGEQAGLRIRSKEHVGCVMEFRIPEEKLSQKKSVNLKK